jgi:hypothetical protein
MTANRGSNVTGSTTTATGGTTGGTTTARGGTTPVTGGTTTRQDNGDGWHNGGKGQQGDRQHNRTKMLQK